MSTLGDETTYDRLRALGVVLTVVNQIVTELENDFGSPDGLRAQKIMADEIISKLGIVGSLIREVGNGSQPPSRPRLRILFCPKI